MSSAVFNSDSSLDRFFVVDISTERYFVWSQRSSGSKLIFRDQEIDS